MLPAKGAGIGGGFHLAPVLIYTGFHLIFGIGAAILFALGRAFIRRRSASGRALHA